MNRDARSDYEHQLAADNAAGDLSLENAALRAENERLRANELKIRNLVERIALGPEQGVQSAESVRHMTWDLYKLVLGKRFTMDHRTIL